MPKRETSRTSKPASRKAWIWPPISGWLEKEVPRQGDVIEGRFVRGGTKIAVCGWYMGKVYGDDAEMFRPERWLDADARQVREMQKVLDLIFGYGRFGCLGKPVAFIELNKVFVEVNPSLTSRADV
jgi:hypothetical protein